MVNVRQICQIPTTPATRPSGGLNRVGGGEPCSRPPYRGGSEGPSQGPLKSRQRARWALGIAVALSVWSFGHSRAQAQPTSLPVVLLPASGLNVAPGIMEAARDLLKDHLQRTGRYTVLTGPGASTTEEPTAAMAIEQARSANAQQAMVLRLTHLGSSTRVRFTVYALSGQVVYWDSIAITGGPGDMDVVLQRLVRAMVTGKPVRDSAELDTVTSDEMSSLNRRTANKTFGLHLFTLLPVNTPGDKFTAVPGVGLFWMYDARSWMADIAFDLGGHSGNVIVDVALGAYYPFYRDDFTPYIGAKLKYGYFSYGGSGSAGVAVEPTVGILLGRTSSVQIRAELGYFVDTFTEDSKTTDGVTVAGPSRLSSGVALTAGLGF